MLPAASGAMCILQGGHGKAPNKTGCLKAQREALLMQLAAVDSQIAALHPQHRLCNGHNWNARNRQLCLLDWASCWSKPPFDDPPTQLATLHSKQPRPTQVGIETCCHRGVCRCARGSGLTVMRAPLLVLTLLACAAAAVSGQVCLAPSLIFNLAHMSKLWGNPIAPRPYHTVLLLNMMQLVLVLVRNLQRLTRPDVGPRGSDTKCRARCLHLPAGRIDDDSLLVSEPWCFSMCRARAGQRVQIECLESNSIPSATMPRPERWAFIWWTAAAIDSRLASLNRHEAAVIAQSSRQQLRLSGCAGMHVVLAEQLWPYADDRAVSCVAVM